MTGPDEDVLGFPSPPSPDLDWAPNDATLVSAGTDGSACVWATAPLVEGLGLVRELVEQSPNDAEALQRLMEHHHLTVECEQCVPAFPFVNATFLNRGRVWPKARCTRGCEEQPACLT
jgi:hypothetical protein